MGDLRNYMQTHFGETVNFEKWSQIYYPAASAAYAYQPTVPSTVQLADKFKAHNWFLPAIGLLVRLCWYFRLGDNDDGNIFKDAIAEGHLFHNFTSANFWSSSEYGSGYTWYVTFGGGYSSNTNKYNTNRVRAVAAF